MTHIHFCNTPRKHERTENCWCKPRHHIGEPTVMVHGNVDTHKSVDIDMLIAKSVDILNEWENTK